MSDAGLRHSVAGGGLQPDAPVGLRPNVLAHPSPTTGRFLLLIGTLLSVGLLVGVLVHNAVRGREWGDAAKACFAQPVGGDDLESVLARGQQVAVCLAPAERVRAGFSFGGAATIGALGLLVLLVIPPLVRRRAGLRSAGERLVGAIDRIGELGREAGVGKTPTLLLGPAGQRDAFVFGLPWRYYLVLPTALAVRWRSRGLFDPVVRHELAHLRRHDVQLAWLATAVWIAAVPVLALPIAVAVARWEFSILPPFLWRAALVMAILWLVRRQVLRSREHDADLFAASQAGDWRPLGTILSTMTTAAAASTFRRFLSHHPTVAQRLKVLAEPGRVRGVSFVDGLVSAFLAAILLPMLHNTIQVLTGGTPVFSWSPQIAAAVVGPIIGLAVGVGLWREAMIDHVTGRNTWPGGVVLGVVAGLLLGHWTHFYDLGVAEAYRATTPVTIVVGAGAVLLSAGTGRLWADAAARLPGGPRSWWLGFTVNALIFAFAMWMLTWLPLMLELLLAGAIDPATLLVVLGSLLGPLFYLILTPLVVACAALVWRRRVLPVPQWLVDGERTAWPASAHVPGLGFTVLAGVASGVCAAAGVTAYRLIIGKPLGTEADTLARYLVWLLTGAIVALVVSFVTLVLVPRSGAAVGLVTGVFAAASGALLMAATNTVVFGNIFEPAFYLSTITAVVALWLLGYLLLLPLTLATWPLPWRDVPGWLLLMLSVIGAGLAALCVVGLSVALR